MTGGRLAVLAAGPKGHDYVAGLVAREFPLEVVVSYQQSDDPSDAFARLRSLCSSRNIAFEDDRRPVLASNRIYVAVGWQFLLNANRAQLIVFHDSILPKLRGFAPTVTALITGLHEIGVTALCPVAEIDAGPIYAQAHRSITYPIKIADALAIQVDLMLELTRNLVESHRDGSLTATEQDHTEATFSIWRDTDDYRINWTWSADRIVRAIDALGPPYAGAQTTYFDDAMIVVDAIEVEDLDFAIRQPGKVWALHNGQPTVVCGRGCVAIQRATTPSGEPFALTRLRGRFI